MAIESKQMNSTYTGKIVAFFTVTAVAVIAYTAGSFFAPVQNCCVHPLADQPTLSQFLAIWVGPLAAVGASVVAVCVAVYSKNNMEKWRKQDRQQEIERAAEERSEFRTKIERIVCAQLLIFESDLSGILGSADVARKFIAKDEVASANVKEGLKNLIPTPPNLMETWGAKVTELPVKFVAEVSVTNYALRNEMRNFTNGFGLEESEVDQWVDCGLEARRLAFNLICTITGKTVDISNEQKTKAFREAISEFVKNG